MTTVTQILTFRILDAHCVSCDIRMPAHPYQDRTQVDVSDEPIYKRVVKTPCDKDYDWCVYCYEDGRIIVADRSTRFAQFMFPADGIYIIDEKEHYIREVGKSVYFVQKDKEDAGYVLIKNKWYVFSPNRPQGELMEHVSPSKAIYLAQIYWLHRTTRAN